MQEPHEEDEQKQTSPHPSAVMRIYRHALEAICGMLDLQDLIQILAVCRDWAAAVRSMAPIHGTVARDEWRLIHQRNVLLLPDATFVASPLLRHVATIQISHMDGCWTPLDNASLGLLAQLAPHLTSLRCELTLTPNESLILPSKLASAQLKLDGKHTAASINGVLTALAALPSLSHLRLCISAFVREVSDVDLSLLGACLSLSALTVENLRGSAPKLSDAQVKQIRSSFGHLQRISVGWMDSGLLARFLQPPVTLRWQDIGFVEADARTGELLLRLPSLTKLDLGLSDDGGHVRRPSAAAAGTHVAQIGLQQAWNMGHLRRRSVGFLCALHRTQ